MKLRTPYLPHGLISATNWKKCSVANTSIFTSLSSSIPFQQCPFVSMHFRMHSLMSLTLYALITLGWQPFDTFVKGNIYVLQYILQPPSLKLMLKHKWWMACFHDLGTIGLDHHRLSRDLQTISHFSSIHLIQHNAALTFFLFLVFSKKPTFRCTNVYLNCTIHNYTLSISSSIIHTLILIWVEYLAIININLSSQVLPHT